MCGGRTASSEEPFPAAFYAALHRGNPGDLRFYRAACRDAETVLELGCGAGRVLTAIAADGADAVGLESHPGLASMARTLARTTGARVVEGEMESFDLGSRFDRVLIPYNGIYCLLSRERVLACLRAARDHLRPEGLLVFDAWAADAFHHEAEPTDVADDHLEEVARIEVGGARYRVLEKSRWWPREQRIDATYVHEPEGEGERLSYTIAQRYLLIDEVASLLDEAGLEPLVFHGDFDQSVYDEDADHLIVTAAIAR